MILFIIVVLVIIPVIFALFSFAGDSKYRKESKNTLNEIIEKKNVKDYDYEQFEDGSILLDDRTNRMFHVINGYDYVSRREENIVDVELVVDDAVAYHSSLSSVTGRAIVGGVIAGGVGAIIGGLTGRQKGRKKIHRIELILSYGEGKTKYNRITILSSKDGEDIFHDRTNKAYERGLYWSKNISSRMGIVGE